MRAFQFRFFSFRALALVLFLLCAALVGSRPASCAPTLYILTIGDSKVQGIGGTLSRLGVPTVVSPGYYGAGYASVPVLTLGTAYEGTGGAYAAAIMDPASYPPSGRGIAVYPLLAGSGYIHPGAAPQIIVTGGTPTTVATFTTAYTGGASLPLEQRLIADGYTVRVVNLGVSGSGIAGLAPPGNYQSQAMVAAIQNFGAANCLVIASTGVNDSNGGTSASSWAGYFATLSAWCKTNGVKLGANKTYWVEQPDGALTEPQRTASNSLLSQYASAIDSYIAAHPADVTLFTDEHAIISASPSIYYTVGGIHANDVAHAALAADMAPKVEAYIRANFPASAPPPARGCALITPDSGFPARVLGDQVQGSQDGTNYTSIGVVGQESQSGGVTALTCDPNEFRYVRLYDLIGNQYCGVAEVALYAGPTATGTRMTGTPFGSTLYAGPYSAANAFDANATTLFQSSDIHGFVGIDTGAKAAVPVPAALSSSATGVTAPLSWGAVARAAGYRVYRDGGSTPVYDGTALSYVDLFAAGSAHTYTVTAYNAGGESAKSASALAAALAAASYARQPSRGR